MNSPAKAGLFLLRAFTQFLQHRRFPIARLSFNLYFRWHTVITKTLTPIDPFLHVFSY
jgi:hypothetical protein